MFEDTTGLWIMSHAHKQRLSEKAFSVKLKNKTRGVILDYAFIDEDDTRWIIDFKVNTATTADELDLDYEIETYAKQLELYRYTLSQIENNIIRCGLYFPVSKVFWELPQGFNPQ